MHDGLEEAGRHLMMVNDHLSEDSVEQGDICMTQVPAMFSDDEEQEEPETEIPVQDDDILISTQVQGAIDEIDHQETVVHSFRNVLSKFALETQEQEVTEDLAPRAKKKVPVKKVIKPSKPKIPTVRLQKRIKSITQFNTDNWESHRVKDRAQKMISMLSGKSVKIKKLVSKLNSEATADAEDSKDSFPTEFATFDESEWGHIVTLLREKLPKVSRTELNSVQQYVYGNGDEARNLWEASQWSPEKKAVSQISDGESETVLPGLTLDRNLPVYTLSQLVEGRSVGGGDEHSVLREESYSIIEQEPPISIDVPSSETEIPSHVADSCDSGSIISFEEHDFLAQNKDALENYNLLGLLPPTTLGIPTTTGFRSDYIKTNNNDLLPNVSQTSYDIVSSIVSPTKAQRTGTIQVPATRTTTFQDQQQIVKPLKAAVKIYVDSNFDSNDDSNGPKADVDIQEHESLSTLTTSMLHDDNEIIIDSEDERGKYSIMEVLDVPPLDPNQYRDPPASPPQRLKTPVSAADSLDSQLQQPLLTTQNASPNTAKLRKSFKTIGLKPCKNKIQMLQVWETLKAKFPASSDEDRYLKLKQFLTDLIVQNRDESAFLMEQIYTFEPIRYESLKRWLVALNSFTELIDDSFIKNWADLNGIVFRNDPENLSESQTQTQSQSQMLSQSLSQLQSPSLSP
ncbi:unnamed protein product [Kluyveromyces dobzhanskii CBS 2104]|uniref:Structure-specific endonuclease subunit SLX4 n=1 Tax=Kluyveromyces dobzhanskii CBS 2104 TaxID=1427455 RepID=A0A0A8L4J3_9SACH|nr:unnamed protein product [Kluyveromyces dobzhanskii CBS 2104]